MKKVYISGCFGSNVSSRRLSDALQRSIHYFQSKGCVVFCPYMGVRFDDGTFMRWWRSMPSFFSSDMAVFPSFWKSSAYSRMEMWMCRILNKSFMVKVFD